LSHGGGCGCKIAPALLRDILSDIREKQQFPSLLVGAETSDDAAVYQLNPQQAIVATTDFFMPIVDDPFDFGRIAATNALSDFYAMGATPILALAIVGMPINVLPLDAIRRILQGGESVCASAGIPIAGGHSIDTPEPIYGLVALGVIHPDKLKRNSAARAGDTLILGKGLGIGVLAQAMKKGLLDPSGYHDLIETTTQLNRIGSQLAEMAAVHALTDVTGFGLLGHLLEVCRGAGVGAELDMRSIPLITAARALAQQGIGPGAIERNLAGCAADVRFDAAVPDWQRRLLADPQTSGGLLVSVAAAQAQEILALFHQGGFHQAACIGSLRAGAPEVCIRA